MYFHYIYINYAEQNMSTHFSNVLRKANNHHNLVKNVLPASLKKIYSNYFKTLFANKDFIFAGGGGVLLFN